MSLFVCVFLPNWETDPQQIRSTYRKWRSQFDRVSIRGPFWGFVVPRLSQGINALAASKVNWVIFKAISRKSTKRSTPDWTTETFICIDVSWRRWRRRGLDCLHCTVLLGQLTKKQLFDLVIWGWKFKTIYGRMWSIIAQYFQHVKTSSCIRAGCGYTLWHHGLTLTYNTCGNSDAFCSWIHSMLWAKVWV